jgi:hypothetical protein
MAIDSSSDDATAYSIIDYSWRARRRLELTRISAES